MKFHKKAPVSESVCWKTSMSRILTGMILCAVTLNLWNLNYLLPAIGMLFSLIGFRSLKKENKWFTGCYVLTVLQTLFFFLMLTLNTTIIQNSFSHSSIASALSFVNLLFPTARALCLWMALKTIVKEHHLEQTTGCATALVFWNLLMIGLALISYQGILLSGAMIIVFIIIMQNMFTLTDQMETAGYVPKPRLISLSDSGLTKIILAVFFTGCVIGYLFFESYTMNWQTPASFQNAKTTAIREHLLNLGFPEDILMDLSEEDILACKGAVQVVSHTSEEEVGEQDTSLFLSGVGVKLSEEENTWKIFHHFLWNTPPKFHGTEALQLWPVYRDIPKGWNSLGELTGQLIYQKDGETFVAPYHSLASQTVSSSNFMMGEHTNTDIFATFSMPPFGDRCSGYVSYCTQMNDNDSWLFSSWCNYVHQLSWIQYPVITAMEHKINYGWNSRTFFTAQHALQFYPEDEIPKPLS